MGQNNNNNHQRTALSEWKKSLVIAVTGLFLFEALSGLLIYFGPFNLSNQFFVLFHTVVGLVWIMPYIVYQLTHWLGVREQRMTHFKLLGYSLWVAVSICGISGIVLTVQAVWGTRISFLWDLVHIVSTFASLALLIAHLAFVLASHLRGKAAEFVAQMRRAQWGFFGKSIGWMAVFGVVTLGAMSLYRPVDTTYQFPSDYSYKYGKDRPFAPSLVQTAHGGTINPRALAESEKCGTSRCHAQIVEEWLPSAHRYSSMDKVFQAIQSVMASNEGAESTRYCAGCHDPIALFSGNKNVYSEDLSSFGANEGISCIVCHSIIKTDVKGNANYTIAEQKRYAFELKEGKLAKFLSDFLLRSYPKHHISSYTRDIYKTPEYCAACHKQFIDQEINKVGWVQLQNQYDNWKASHWHEGRTENKVLSCRECHMRLVSNSRDPARGDAQDYNRSPNDRKHRIHRFIGANQFIPALQKLPGWEEQVRLTEEWLRGETEIPEIADKWAEGPAVDLKIEAPKTISPGQELTYKVVIHSNKVGHDFPTGPLDLIQAWVDTDVIDASGRILYHSGKLDSSHFLEEDTFIFKAEGIDKQGNLIDRHNLWEMIGARFKRVIFPGFSDVAGYRFLCPDMPGVGNQKSASFNREETHRAKLSAEPGELRIRATLRYRKIDQYLINYAFGAEAGITTPVTDMTKAEKVVKIMPQVYLGELHHRNYNKN